MRSVWDVALRAGTLRNSELINPTITITNLGELSVEGVFGVIYPPRVAMAGFGKVLKWPGAVERRSGCVSRSLCHCCACAALSFPLQVQHFQKARVECLWLGRAVDPKIIRR